MSYYLTNIDYDKHNEEVKQVWDAYYNGSPTRVPVILGVNPRIIILNSEINSDNVTFEQYCEKPDIMVETQVKALHYIRHNLLQDAEMGLPKDGWRINIDFQNVYEASWFGCKIEYHKGQVPDTKPILNEDNKHMLFDRGIPDPFKDNSMGKNWQFYEHVRSNLYKYCFYNLPVIDVTPAGLGTDGPMTVACNLRGATEMCLDMYENPDYAHQLLQYVTESTILRIKEYRKALNQELKPQFWGFADDSIELLSVETYREFVLPYHKKLVAELAGSGPHSIHLCGNASHLLPTIKQELNVMTWDSGFPVDHGKMRQLLGEDFTIQGGPTVATLLNGTPEDVEEECRRILESGVMTGGKFILREANNLSPCTPVENVSAMYEAAKSYGKYS